MVITCQHCQSRLQIADEKVPQRAFSLRCPKCRNVIQASAENLEASRPPSHRDALSSGTNPSLNASRAGRSEPPPLYATPPVAVQPGDFSGGNSDSVHQLLEMLTGLGGAQTAAPQHEQRRALVCVAPAYRDKAGETLSAQGYQTYLAKNCRQATEQMHNELMPVIVLDVDFSPEEQGFARLSQEVRSLRPAQRRRVLLVKLAPNIHTLDRHAAFLQSVNLLVNTSELHLLPDALERTRRHYNELYKPFFEALQVAPI